MRGGRRYVNDRDWHRLVEQLGRGECTPFLGAGACHPTLPTAGQLSEIWAKEYNYPFLDRTNLPRVMQHAALLEGDHVTVKQHVADTLRSRGRPDFAVNTESHALLAKLPLSVYLTTNYDDFMVSALKRENKRPHLAICPWYEGARPDARLADDTDFVPSVDEPIVYHLHGSFQDPRSLVLTEEDYLEFLITLAMDRGAGGRELIPTPILPHITKWPLLFIGYSLQDWTFLVIFHGLLRTVAGVQKRRHVSVQCPPLPDGDPKARARAKKYLTSYFEEWKISVFWGTAQEFCTELRFRLGES
jgi:SIR2-like domain